MRNARAILFLTALAVFAAACSQYRQPRTEPPTPSGPIITQPPGTTGG